MPGKRGKKPTRGKMGRIDQLPQELKDLIHKLFRAGVSQAEVKDTLKLKLAAIGQPPISAATINRYASKMEQVGVRMRQAREVADAWTSKFGESESKISQHIIEVLRVLIFEHTLQVAEAQDAAGGDGADGTPLSHEAIAGLALAAQRIERAAEMGAKRERDLRQELAGVVDAEAKRQGLAKDTAAAIRAALLGDAAHAAS